MKNNWSNLEAKKYINKYKKLGHSKDMALRVYTTRLLGIHIYHFVDVPKSLKRILSLCPPLWALAHWDPELTGLAGVPLLCSPQSLNAKEIRRDARITCNDASVPATLCSLLGERSCT